MSEHGEGAPPSQEAQSPDFDNWEINEWEVNATEPPQPRQLPDRDDKEGWRRHFRDEARQRIRALGATHRLTSREDPEHQAEILRKRQENWIENGPDKDIIFGAGTLHRVDFLRAGILQPDPLMVDDPDDEEAARGQEIAFEFELARKKLIEIAGNHRRLDQLTTELAATMDIPPIDSGENSTGHIQNLIANLSDQQIEALLREHEVRVRQRLAEREAELEPLIGNFLDAIEAAHAKDEFPLSRAQTANLLSGTALRFYDPWTKPDGYHGSQDFIAGEVQLNLNLASGAMLQKTTFHELLHVIVGVMAQVEHQANPHGKLDMSQSFNIHTPRLKQGVAITPDISLNRQQRFDWLGEAITEDEALALTNTEDSDSYVEDRVILNRLKKRVDRKLFVAAQYQPYSREEGTPAWGELNKQINERFEPRLLLTLDKLIREQGIDAAIEYMDTHFPEAPAA